MAPDPGEGCSMRNHRRRPALQHTMRAILAALLLAPVAACSFPSPTPSPEALPDLQSLIPEDRMTIVHPAGGPKELSFSHLI
jgi:hypothetical protein